MHGDLQTRRLQLRALVPSDERLYCALYTDPYVMRHVAAPLAPEAARRAFSTVLAQLAGHPPLSHYWILAPRAAGAPLGLMACLPDRDDRESAEVGVLLRAGAEGQGYAAEAIAALADAVFAVPGLERLWTRHARDHGLAGGLMRKLGFSPMEHAGGDARLVRWQLARQAWLQRRVFASPGGNC